MDKRVDESWKEQVEKEKSQAAAPPPRAAGPQPPAPGRDEPAPSRKAPSGEFGMFLSSLSMQAMMALGELPHPVTQERQEDLEQARYLIDILGMLQAKTQGNLTAEEGQLLEGLLYELRMKYVSKTREVGA